MEEIINVGTFSSFADLEDFLSGEGSISDAEARGDELEQDFCNEWIYVGGSYIPARNTVVKPQVAPGQYDLSYDKGQFSMFKVDVDTDELYPLPNENINEILDEIDVFWSKKDLFAKEKFVHKRGVLLHGHPGAGKSSMIARLTQSAIERGGVVFNISGIGDLSLYINFIHNYFRPIQPETPIITILEDIDALIHDNERLVLNYLDGEDQFEHNVTIATTNRITELNDLLLRPSRFDWVMEFELPNREVRQFFLEKRGLDKETATKWTKDTDGFSMAELKELYLSVRILDNDYNAVIDKINSQGKEAAKNTTFKSKAKSSSIGFGT